MARAYTSSPGHSYSSSMKGEHMLVLEKTGWLSRFGSTPNVVVEREALSRYEPSTTVEPPQLDFSAEMIEDTREDETWHGSGYAGGGIVMSFSGVTVLNARVLVNWIVDGRVVWVVSMIDTARNSKTRMVMRSDGIACDTTERQ